MATQVEQLLRDKDIYFVSKGKDLLVKCFNPEHDDSSPSMRVHREEGIYHCLSCGYKGNIFHDFNKHRDVFNARVSELQEKIRNLHIQASGVPTPSDAFPFYKSERGIKAETYKDYLAFTSESQFENRIVFPIVDYTGKIQGFNARHRNPHGAPKYIVYPPGADFPLYPPIKKLINNSLVLVEGLYDAINCRDKGMSNAVCTFGTQRLSLDSIHEKLLPHMIRGVDKVFILFDGDKAGKEGAIEVKKMIKMKTDLIVEILHLPEGKDPGELTIKEVELLIKLLTDWKN